MNKTDKILFDLQYGTIISGTYRTQDLIPVFLEALAIFSPDEYEELMLSPIRSVPAYAMEDDQAIWWNSEEAQYLLESLLDMLDASAVEGLYFGAHPGNSSDFGYWHIEEGDL